ERTPEPMKRAVRSYGAEVVEVPGTIREAGETARIREKGRGSFDMSTLREPYRVEGKKTMGFEIVEQTGTEGLPDAILYPTGGGTGLVGMAKAFRELRTLGLLDRIPRLYAVQPEGCAPVVRALVDGAPKVTPWPNPRTIAPGLLVPEDPRGDPGDPGRRRHGLGPGDPPGDARPRDPPRGLGVPRSGRAVRRSAEAPPERRAPSRRAGPRLPDRHRSHVLPRGPGAVALPVEGARPDRYVRVTCAAAGTRC